MFSYHWNDAIHFREGCHQGDVVELPRSALNTVMCDRKSLSSSFFHLWKPQILCIGHWEHLLLLLCDFSSADCIYIVLSSFWKDKYNVQIFLTVWYTKLQFFYFKEERKRINETINKNISRKGQLRMKSAGKYFCAICLSITHINVHNQYWAVDDDFSTF